MNNFPLTSFGLLAGVLVAAMGKGGRSLGGCNSQVVMFAAYLVVGGCAGCGGAGVVHKWEEGDEWEFFF